MKQATAVILIGVSGSGKTTVGRALAAALGCSFYDGDDFHPLANVAKMAQGIPLNDEERAPWLATLHDLIAKCLAEEESAVFACSALKKKYRERLREGNAGALFVYLRGPFDLIQRRMEARREHYMKADMLSSQFAALEKPSMDEAIVVNAVDDVTTIVTAIIAALEKSGY